MVAQKFQLDAMELLRQRVMVARQREGRERFELHRKNREGEQTLHDIYIYICIY